QADGWGLAARDNPVCGLRAAALGLVRRRDARRRAAGLRAGERGFGVSRPDPWRRDAQRDHRRIDAVPDRERACDLRPRLSRQGLTAAPDEAAGNRARVCPRRLIYFFKKSSTASL